MTAPGAFIAGRYRLVRRVATGGMGSVWEARDELLQRRVAVKQLLPQPGMSTQDAAMARSRVIREARITARLHHPNAVTLYDVVEDSGNPCLIMQYVPSRSLHSLLLEREPLNLQAVARIGAEVASALTAAHEVGIVHRDVKPSNVLITQDGSAKLTDFGISHAAGDVNLTSTGMVSGTPAYLAPEVARGGSSGFPADVFSLGATLYTALEGSPPFGAEQNPMALLHRVASGQSLPPRRSGQLTPLLVRMLAPDAVDRPPMHEVAKQLRALAEDGPTAEVVAVPVPPAPDPVERMSATPATLPRQHRRIGALVAGALAVAVAAILVGFLTLGRDRGSQNAGSPAVSTAGLPASDASSSAGRSSGAAVPAQPKTAASAPNSGLTTARSPSAGALQIAPPTGSTAVHPTSVQRNPPIAHSTSKPSSASVKTSATSVRTSATSAKPSNTSAKPSTTSAKPTTTISSTTIASSTSVRRATSVQTSTSDRTTQETSPAAAGSDQLVGAVTDYYALMPGNTDSGWARLTTSFRNDIAKNRQAYQNFWDGIDRVDVSDAVGASPDKVLATLTYHFADGRVSVERTSYTLVQDGGILKIDHSEVVAGP